MAEVEIITRDARKWSAAEKAALLAEVEAEGGKVALVARRHRMSESLLYNWRSACKAAAVAMGEPEPSSSCRSACWVGASDCGPALLAPPTPEHRSRRARRRADRPERSRLRCRTAPAFASMPS